MQSFVGLELVGYFKMFQQIDDAGAISHFRASLYKS